MISVVNFNCSSGGRRCAHRSFHVIIGVLPHGKGMQDGCEVGKHRNLNRFGKVRESDESITWAVF
jgi:hypothetical protein